MMKNIPNTTKEISHF